jgi:hypothetical protein
MLSDFVGLPFKASVPMALYIVAIPDIPGRKVLFKNKNSENSER